MLAPSRLSLIAGVVESLRAAIRTGELREHLPGVRTLSKDLCVSVPTVLEAIRVLAKDGYVRVRQGSPTEILVSPSALLSTARRGPKKVVFLGFAPEDLEDSVFYREVFETLSRRGYLVERHQFARKVWLLKAQDFDRFVQNARADCWILVDSPLEVQKAFAARGLPCLLKSGVSREGMDLPDFEIDFAAVYRHAAHQLLNLGHKRIYLLIAEHSAAKNPASIEAFVEAVRERLPDQSRRTLVKTHDGSVAHFKAILSSLFDRTARPTGLFISFVNWYILTASWLQTRGYLIPGDVSLLCRDGSEMLEFLEPSPAHYVHSERDSLRRFLKAIAAIAEKVPFEDHTLIVPRFIKGQSLGAAPGFKGRS